MGGYRNHCPTCLYSKHVDIIPGDRANPCQGLMQPIAVEYLPQKGWMIVCRCTKCGHQGRNKATLSDSQPDNLDRIIELSANP
ncbi:MAG: hypothetical protein UU40_C0001G0010 [Candidatus Uhrbacteria bacterium GW2011_GWD2_41_121]|uniref:RNHCP domain-containing protein n=1 Tax=Candidatus Uhrbacteria bacterium GW2011_GWC1_41_20 TaxID=1618983 RepID=A0A0G0XSY9_9BACT|nr:MAG: hypothetical protein UT52_C0001G0059 [Candidatus Uhrbacteria bacterium GW2011_GWE1_39_46]KKR64448.1 MAG: hypothetical protein UU04_C0002G0060 [Candidatus Uhrbacteria bacterium GW2011_GWC2_40_450]KKR90673.1 MAG: hypothetical protein UU40_C0001G0010 [Candidatus Uhrbacteria bacterium GW2011_GWD2_41_121]KKR96609.1 MAG: hypothetical protein UU46_C0001G0059 [Candidatus Uhrbacteria bacterium GW2011_GWD1_41_16]KKS00076.1 MAG: hypothetical protein UU50_C0001G0059 [Candidatus Uhrbacteria bacteriu